MKSLRKLSALSSQLSVPKVWVTSACILLYSIWKAESGKRIAFLALFFLIPQASFAIEITYRHNHHLFSLNSAHHKDWRALEPVWTYYGVEVIPPSGLRAEGNEEIIPPEGFEKSFREVWDTDAIAKTIQEKIGDAFNRSPGSVVISSSGTGAITFEGIGLPGREIDLYQAALLTVKALESEIYDVVLPVTETQPLVTVATQELLDFGIREVVSVGESDYAGSPNARQHNIRTGLEKFNGHFVAQDEEFSFNEVLGPVNASTGYLKELVINGERTLPDYGGGLCQVSTTAYRGIWEYGFPITERYNHSYTVRYYSPSGTDATIYPPYKDVKFRNDGPSALAIQTHTADGKAYFIYYGTRDSREAEIIGPYVRDKAAPPPQKIEYTTDIAAGTTRDVGQAVPGLKSTWYRVVRKPESEDEVQTVFSHYEARPHFVQVGVEEGDIRLYEDEVERFIW